MVKYVTYADKVFVMDAEKIGSMLLASDSKNTQDVYGHGETRKYKRITKQKT